MGTRKKNESDAADGDAREVRWRPAGDEERDPFRDDESYRGLLYLALEVTRHAEEMPAAVRSAMNPITSGLGWLIREAEREAEKPKSAADVALDAWLEERRRAREAQRPSVPPIDVPEEPEQLNLWRQIATRRDAIVATIVSWERFRSEQRAAFVHVGPSSAQEIQRSEVIIDGHLSSLRKRLRDLDREILKGTREDANAEKGITLLQLRALVQEAEGATRKAVEAAIVDWLKDRENPVRKHHAEALLRSANWPSEAPVDLDTLRSEDLELRREQPELPGSTKRVAQRIMNRARAL